jgi:hypothetical protein
LISAAIVYLGGVLLGFIPRSPAAVSAALSIVLVAASLGVLSIERRLTPGETHDRLLMTAVLLLSAMLVLAGLTSTGLGEFAPHNVVLGFGAVLMILSSAWFALSLREGRRNRASRPHIKGMHWYEWPTRS